MAGFCWSNSFCFLYFGLCTWFLYKSFKLFESTFSGSKDGVLNFIVGALTGFLGLFMLKAVFFKSRKDKSESIEITKEDQPVLFEFIYKVADDAKAPRPHKVFVSNVVNACVFYDISFVNLFFPTRKNLEIGLGLVNVLNLGEFKSILAHEFGHFAQRSMIVGRWVYIAQKVAYQIVAKRDGFDTFLRGLSNSDFRVAWVGWILSIIIWSVRSVSESFFKIVLITERALSREMEFHADLVAVSLTGSDALIHSLYKLNVADEAYEEAIEFVNKQLKKEKAVSDVFAIQSNSIKHMAIILNNPVYGATPQSGGAAFRVFKDQIAQSPKMWSTHPSNIDREKNAKAVYIECEGDGRSPWLLFKDTDGLKQSVTKTLYKDVSIKTISLSRNEEIELHTQEFQRSFLLPQYRGLYFNRSTTLPYKQVDDLYDQFINPADLSEQWSLLYPASLQQDLEHLKDLEEELQMLEGLNNKVLDTNEGKINYRNREVDRKELPEIIGKVKVEIELVRNAIEAHDKFCRNLHLTAAKEFGKGWPEYLHSIVSLVHYCEHSQENILVLNRHFYNTLHVASQIRRIDSSEMLPLLRSANSLYEAIGSVFTKSREVSLSNRLLEKMGGKQFEELLEPFKLNEPSKENINSWIGVVNGWSNQAYEALKVLKEAALDELLYTEDHIRKISIGSISPDQAFEAVKFPKAYLKFDRDLKKEVELKPDLISRFYNADGLSHMIGRLAVASLIIFLVIFFSSSVGHSRLIIYNGMPVDVIVSVGGKNIVIVHNGFEETSIDESGAMSIKAETVDRKLIESFHVDVSNSRTYIYNVNYSAVLYETHIYYGYSTVPSGDRNIVIGAKRWDSYDADYYFEDPPSSISLKEGEREVKSIVYVYIDTPDQMASMITDEEERTQFLAAHALWEKGNSESILYWLSVASELKSITQIIHKRLQDNPFEVASLRLQQDISKGVEKTKVCDEQRKLFLDNPGKIDLAYLNCRCMENEKQRDSAFIDGNKRWPNNPWFAYASAYCFAQQGKWEEALFNFGVVAKTTPELHVVITGEMKRISRLMKVAIPSALLDVKLDSYLSYVNSVEQSSENDQKSNLYAYKLLTQGKILDAIAKSKADSNLYYNIVRLAAVSDGASDSIVKIAFNIPADIGINNANLIPAIVLYIKFNGPLEIFRSPLNYITSGKADNFFKFINLVKVGKIKEADQELGSMSAEAKAKGSLLGVLILGNKAPKKWNVLSSALLYINEKPYRLNELTDWEMTDLKL